MNWGWLSKYRTELMGIACIYIMMFHNICDWPNVLKPIEILFSYGNVGVDIFLLLSGVGLCYSYREHSSLSSFYKKRFVRLLAPYLLLGIPYYLWRSFSCDENFLLTITQVAFPLYGYRTTWYVAAISVFYILFPLVYHYLYEKKTYFGKTLSQHTVTMILCLVAAFFCRFVQKYEPEIYANCEIALTRLLIFITGCDLADFVQEERPISQTVFLGCLLFSVVYITAFSQDVTLPDFWIRMSYIPFAIALTVVFAWLINLFYSIRWIQLFLRFFGERSLELYLSHVMLINVWLHYLGRKALDRWDACSYGIILILSICLSAVLHPLVNWISNKLLKIDRTVRLAKTDSE